VLWSTYYAILAVGFGFDNYGILSGTCTLSVAIFGLVQYGILAITFNSFNGNFQFVNLILTLLLLPLLYYPYYLRKHRDTEKITIGNVRGV